MQSDPTAECPKRTETTGLARLNKRSMKGAWGLLLHNRLAVAIASLLWLIYRSGTQPRRLSYPCQQVAALNVGAIAAGLIPTLWLWRRPKCPVARRILVRRQFIAAAILFVTALVGIEGYQYAQTLIVAAAELTVPPPPAPEPPPALVGIAHETLPVRKLVTISNVKQSSPAYTQADINALVDKAVSRAGGLKQIMIDKDGDGIINVVLKPNLVTDINIAATDTSRSPNEKQAERGITTDPRVMARVVTLVKAAGAEIAGKTTTVTIAEGSASGFPWDAGNLTRTITKTAFINCGYTTDSAGGQQYFKPYDPTVELIDLNDSGGLDQHDPTKVTQVTLPYAVIRKNYWVPNILLNCDVLINVPTLKNHGNADMTAALKCQGIGAGPSDIYHSRPAYGATAHLAQMKHAFHFTDVPGLNGWDPGSGGGFYYPSAPAWDDQNPIVNYTIVDMNMVRPMDFAIVDGLVGITNGPSTWPAVHPNPYMQLIIAGKDPVAVDSVAALTMSYDPKYVRYLRLAYNRRLGTMNRGQIEVIGDRPALVRQVFPLGVNRSSTETTPPTLAGINVQESASLVSGAPIIATNVTDNVGVVRTEAAVAVLGGNLVVNGDFEDTQHPVGYGWTTWRTSWGSGEVWDFNNTNIPTGGGQKCLRLGGPNSNTSFGVYQQVTVTPGKTYRLDCQWKGKRNVAWTAATGDPANWFEVILIDGSFSMTEADVDPGVRNNYMFAYDDNTCPFQGPAGTSFGWLWTHELYAPPTKKVDWMNRLGRRTAGGNTMTVVLKAGSNASGGIEAYFDNVTLREVSDDYVVAAVGTAQATDATETPYVASTCNLIADFNGLPAGVHDAELRVTAYDAALNEISLYRNVTVQTCPPAPSVLASPQTISPPGVFEGDPMPSGDKVYVRNVGCAGSGTLAYTLASNVPWLHVPEGTFYSPEGAQTDNEHLIAYDPLPLGQHVGVITVTGPNNVQTVTVIVNVSTPPVEVDFSADETSVTPGLPVQFTDRSTLAGASQWSWDFGDGQTSNLPSPSHAYTGEGRFTVQLTVKGTAKTQTVKKADYITVANPPRVAFIGGDLDTGELWPSAADRSTMDYLRAKGLAVSKYLDSELLSNASTIAADHSLVIASASVTSGDVAGKFRNLAVPFIFWEPSLTWYANPDNRECIANGGDKTLNQTQINVVDNTHPVMAGIGTGSVTVLDGAEAISYCGGQKASGARVLATIVGHSTWNSIMVAEAGATLLDGQPAAARRVFLYLYDTTWTQTNDTGKKIFDNAVSWALNLAPLHADFTASATTGRAPLAVQFTDQSTGPATLWTWDFGDGATSKIRQAARTYTHPGAYAVSLTVGGPLNQPDTLQKTAYVVVSPHLADLDSDGDVDADDATIFAACSTGPGIIGPPAMDCTTAQFAAVDTDHDDDVDQIDFAVFQRCLRGPNTLPNTDCTN